jgi:hypothetical protein
MSTLKVTNIQATGETATRAVSGIAAAWVNFNGTGTIAVRDSFNVASLTDSGVGNYTVNFTSSMNNSDYAPAHGNPDTGAIFYNTQTGGQTVSGTRIRSFVTSTVAATDPLGVGLSIHGDLA